MKSYWLPILFILSACGEINLDNPGTSTTSTQKTYPGAQEPAARFVLHKDNFTNLADYITQKHTQYQCLGDVVKGFYVTGDDYSGSPTAFPISTALVDDFNPTFLPAYIRNISVDMTNTYFPLTAISTVQTDACSYRGIADSAPPSPCADFDFPPPAAPEPYAATTGVGVVTTLAGTAGATPTATPQDGFGPSAHFKNPMGLAVDSSGNIYVADSGDYTIREITPSGAVSTVAGINGTTGAVNGAAASATFSSPVGVAIDASGNIYVADAGANHAIRKITTGGIVSTFATLAAGDVPTGLAFDSSGNLYIANDGTHVIKKIIIVNGAFSSISIYAGTLNTSGNLDGDATTVALFHAPTGVAVDSSGNVYVADSGNNTIREIAPGANASVGGMVSTIAGTGTAGSTAGAALSAQFSLPQSLAVDAAGTVYVVDTNNDMIRQISSGAVITLAGSAGASGSTDSTGAAAAFNLPFGIVLGPSGLMYVSDKANGTIRQISIPPIPTTIPYYGTKYYQVRDDWCQDQGAYSGLGGGDATKSYVGGVDIDLDRTQLGTSEDVLMLVTYQSLNSNASWPGVQGVNDETILNVNLLGTGLGLQSLLGARQPTSTNDYGTPNIITYFKQLATLRDPFGSLRTEQVYIPLSENGLIDRIRIERVRGSFQIYQIDLYRLGNRGL